MRYQPRTETPATERQITSAVLHVRPEQHDEVVRAARDDLGAEVVATGIASKIVVVMEASTLGDLADLMDQCRLLPGVVNATLVYHHVADANELDETVEVAATAPDSAHPRVEDAP